MEGCKKRQKPNFGWDMRAVLQSSAKQLVARTECRNHFGGNERSAMAPLGYYRNSLVDREKLLSSSGLRSR